MFIKYLALAFIAMIAMILNFMLAPIIPLFIGKDLMLPSWLSWFQTTDATATGDQMFWDREMAYTKDYSPFRQRYVRGFNWALRNPGYGYMQTHGLTVGDVSEYDSPVFDVDIGDHGYTLGSVYRTCKNDGKKYFQYKKAGKWSESTAWMLEFGYSIKNLDKEEKGSTRRLIVDIRPRISLKLGGETSA